MPSIVSCKIPANANGTYNPILFTDQFWDHKTDVQAYGPVPSSFDGIPFENRSMHVINPARYQILKYCPIKYTDKLINVKTQDYPFTKNRHFTIPYNRTLNFYGSQNNTSNNDYLTSFCYLTFAPGTTAAEAATSFNTLTIRFDATMSYKTKDVSNLSTAYPVFPKNTDA